MEEYPIHPTFDKLIQAYKEFSRISFPRGIPQPAAAWKDLIQGLTHYESLVILRAQDYLAGKGVSLSELGCQGDFNRAISQFKIRFQADSDYMEKFLDYKQKVEFISSLIRKCADELGNPYQFVRTQN